MDATNKFNLSQRGMAGATIKVLPNSGHEKVKRSWDVVRYIESHFKNQNDYFYCESK